MAEASLSLKKKKRFTVSINGFIRVFPVKDKKGGSKKKRSQYFRLIPQDFPSGTSWVKSVNLVLHWTADDAELSDSHKEIKSRKLWTLLPYANAPWEMEVGEFSTGLKTHSKFHTGYITMMCLLYWEGLLFDFELEHSGWHMLLKWKSSPLATWSGFPRHIPVFKQTQPWTRLWYDPKKGWLV